MSKLKNAEKRAADDDVLGQCPKTNRCSYDAVPLPQSPPSDDGLPMRCSNTATLESLEQAGTCMDVTSACDEGDEKSAIGDVVASGIEFVDE